MKRLILFFVLFLSGISSAQWTEQVSGVNTTLWSVSAVDDNVVWACGSGGKVLLTVNSGLTWTTVTSPNSSIDLYTIQGISASMALVGGADGSFTYAYKTIDGGATWTQTFSQAGGFIDALKMFNGFPGIYGLLGDPVGGRWTQFVSFDYGSTWDSTGFYKPATNTEAGWNNSFFAATPSFYSWYGTNNTKVVQAFANGTTIDLPTPGLPASYAIWGNDNSRLMTGGNIMLYSVDAGATWTNVNAIGAGDIAGIVGGASTWFYVRGSSVYKSINDGATWGTDYTAGSGTYYHMSLSPRGRYIWAIRDNGGISRNELDFPLPVELASFAANVNNREVTLNWSTVAEIDNAGFDVERSAAVNSGEENWSKIGYVKGNGSTSEVTEYSFTDRGLSTGKYNYRLKQVDYNGNFKYYRLGSEVVIGVPEKFSLSQNYPNPFNPSTKINYDVPFDSRVELVVFDMTGKEIAKVVNELKTAGYYTVTFNSSNLPSGVYFYKLIAGNHVETKKMTFVK